jgi:heptaprenylglyceryl phosphate synthase
MEIIYVEYGGVSKEVVANSTHSQHLPVLTDWRK